MLPPCFDHLLRLLQAAAASYASAWYPRRHPLTARLPVSRNRSQSLHIDFIHKGLDVALPAMRAGGQGDEQGDGSNRRLLHSAVERWVQPRAAAIKRLVLS